MIEQLKERINKLENRIDELENRIEDIENELEDFTILKNILKRYIAEYITIGKICDLLLEQNRNTMKIGEFKTDKGVLNVYITLKKE